MTCLPIVRVALPCLKYAFGGASVASGSKENPGSFGSADGGASLGPFGPIEGAGIPGSPDGTGATGVTGMTASAWRYSHPPATSATATSATRTPPVRRRRPAVPLSATYRPLYACKPLNQSDPEYVTRTIPNPTTSSSAAGRPAHERWLRACRYTAYVSHVTSAAVSFGSQPQ